LFKRLVEADGTVQATALADPLQAMASAMQRDYDIVLVDFEMPKMDGVTFLRELRAVSKFTDIPGPSIAESSGIPKKKSANGPPNVRLSQIALCRV
jgi:CheY-like chemotaxis protein